MSAAVAILGPFGDAIDFVLRERESVTGGVQVGGLAEMADLTWSHLKLSLVSMAIAAAVSLPLGLWLGHVGKGEFLAINVSNVGRAVPTLALIAFFIAFVGIGFWNLVIALALLAIPPMLTNTYVGVRQVDPEVIDSARGMGLAEAQIVRRIELPLALPTIFGGLQIAAISVIATAIIAPLASVDTLGTPIISANVYGEDGRLGASIVVALLALLAGGAITALQRAVTPRGIKAGRAERPRRPVFRVPFRPRREQPT